VKTAALLSKPEPKAAHPPQHARPTAKPGAAPKLQPLPALPVFARQPSPPPASVAPAHALEKASIPMPEFAAPSKPPAAHPGLAPVPPSIAPPPATVRHTAPGAPGHIEPVKARLGMPTFRGLASTSPIEGGGEPLTPQIKDALETSFDVDLSSVRVHTDGHAHTVTETLAARAFAYGNHIFLGAAESNSDLGLLAHEAAHVVQQQSVASIQLWAPSRSDGFEYEADRAASAVVRGDKFTVAGRVNKPRVQRSLLRRLLNKLAEWAYDIPGFRLLTVIIGKNPINWEDVDRSPANILRALVELIPGGHRITEALDKYGVFEKLGGWFEQQLQKMAAIGSAIVEDWHHFVDDLSWTDIRHPGKVWDDAKGVFFRAIDRIGRFVLDIARDILDLIKKAILGLLAKLASKQTPGWDLLIAVLGKNPITGETVEPTAENLIGGFMKLIGQEEIWQNIKKANAIPRAWAWFKGVVKGLVSFVVQIPSVFLAALKSLTIEDILILPNAFIKVAKAFIGFIGRFISWAWEQIWTLLQIIFEVLAPSVIPYLKKAGAAFRMILKDPGTFVGNLVKATKQGFLQFRDGFLSYLQAGLIDWLTGAIDGVNIYIPQAFSFAEIIKFVLSVLGLTWQHIRQQRVVQAAITKLLAMLSPAGAFIQAIIAIYHTIVFFVERLRTIGQVAAAAIDSISAIANGIITSAAKKVETTLGGLLKLVISFLAEQAGLGNVGSAIKDIINKVRDPIDKALDRVVEWIVSMSKKAVSGAIGAVKDWWRARFSTKVGDETHTITAHGEGASAEIYIETSPKKLAEFLADLEANPKADKKIVGQIRRKLLEIERLKSGSMGQETGRQIGDAMGAIADLLKTVLPGGVDLPPTTIAEHEKTDVNGSTVGTHVKAEPLSYKPPTSGAWRGSEPGYGNAFFRSVNRRVYTYVQGHLLNHHLFGPGQDFNLVPIHRQLNTQMSSDCEEEVKARVLSQNKVVSYDVKVNFGTWSPRYTHIPEENDLPKSITLKAYEMKKKLNKDGDKPDDWEVNRSAAIYSNTLPNSRGPDEEPTGARHLKRVNLNSRAAEAEKAFQEVYGIGPAKAGTLYAKTTRYTDLKDVIEDLRLPDDCRNRWSRDDHPTVALTGQTEWE
jgi:hypothetical protein